MKCWLPNVHELFLCIGFSFYGYYSSQQLSQNNILFTAIKFKTFQDFVKFKDFKALNLVQSNSRLFKTFKVQYGPWYIHKAKCYPPSQKSHEYDEEKQTNDNLA